MSKSRAYYVSWYGYDYFAGGVKVPGSMHLSLADYEAYCKESKDISYPCGPCDSKVGPCAEARLVEISPALFKRLSAARAKGVLGLRMEMKCEGVYEAA